MDCYNVGYGTRGYKDGKYQLYATDSEYYEIVEDEDTEETEGS